jgi:hypothetical protein
VPLIQKKKKKKKNPTSALRGAGLRGSALDLAVAVAEGYLLAYEVTGRMARDGVGDVNPCDTSVGMRGSPHEAGSMFDDPVKLEADWGRVECGLEGRALSELPLLGLSRDVRDIDDLEVGGRRDRGRLNGHNTRDGDKTADMLEHARGFGGEGMEAGAGVGGGGPAAAMT